MKEINNERDLVEAVIRDKEQGTYYIAKYIIKKLNITNTEDFNHVSVKVETQRILKQYVSDQIKTKIINKIKHMPN